MIKFIKDNKYNIAGILIFISVTLATISILLKDNESQKYIADIIVCMISGLMFFMLYVFKD